MIEDAEYIENSFQRLLEDEWGREGGKTSYPLKGWSGAVTELLGRGHWKGCSVQHSGGGGAGLPWEMRQPHPNRVG